LSEFSPLDGIGFRADGFHVFLPEVGLFVLNIRFSACPDEMIGYFPFGLS